MEDPETGLQARCIVAHADSGPIRATASWNEFIQGRRTGFDWSTVSSLQGWRPLMYRLKRVYRDRTFIVGFAGVVIILFVWVLQTLPPSARSELQTYLRAARDGDAKTAATVVCPTSSSYLQDRRWQSDLAQLGAIEDFTILRGNADEGWFRIHMAGRSETYALSVDRSVGPPCIDVGSGLPLGIRE